MSTYKFKQAGGKFVGSLRAIHFFIGKYIGKQQIN